MCQMGNAPTSAPPETVPLAQADTMTSENDGLLFTQERIGGSVGSRKPSIEANWLDDEQVALLDFHANTDSEDIESVVM